LLGGFWGEGIVVKATDRIDQQVAATKRELSGDTLKELRRVAKKLNVSVDSLVWLLTPVFSSGHVRSAAYNDCPPCVVEDGLVIERFGSSLAYVPWMMTDKAKEIVEKTRA